MPQVIKRVRYVPSPSRRRTHELGLNLPPGDWLVWWYSSLFHNVNDATVPLVKVYFRRLDGETLTNDWQTRLLALSRLCFYQPGLILVDNKVVAKVASEAVWFDVSFVFQGNHWSFHTAAQLGLCQANSPYSLPPGCLTDWSIVFAMGEKRLQMNCVEFLVRGYSRGSEIPRILTTYNWGEATARLFSKETPLSEQIPKKQPLTGKEKWIVYPQKGMKREDDTLLAHLANDEPYGATSARNLFAELNNNEFASGNSHSLQVRPWFNGATKLKCRGFWSDDGKTFLCTELVGMKMPSGFPIEARRDKAEQADGAPNDLPAGDGSRLAKGDLDSIPTTDRSQPRSSYPREDVEDDEFEVIDDRVVDRVQIKKPYERRKKHLKEEAPPEKYSTGDPQGQRDPTTGKVVKTTRELSVNSEGVPLEMWRSFQRLKETKQIDNVGWFVPPSSMRPTDPPSYILFSEEGRMADETKWLTLRDGNLRGMLALIVTIGKKKFLVVEIQRNLVRKKGHLVEESLCGFICPVADSGAVQRILTILNAEVPRQEGKFKQIKKLIPSSDYFEHQPSGVEGSWFDSTAVLALGKMGVKVKRPPRPAATHVSHQSSAQARTEPVTESALA
ncbi:hypothetical protein ABZQ24_00560 [Pseudomonas aeruginosa]|nr:hypothetical protein [Pseudomonas aeruginosa]